MANLNGDIKKWKRGETAGFAATVFCGVVLVAFVICYPLSLAQGLKTLQLATLIAAPVLLVLGAGIAAFCNLRFGGALEKAIRQYVLDVFVENAGLMHPERNSLSFYVSVRENAIELTVNGYKEKIIFDFSALGKLSLMRKASVLAEIENRLCVTFCRLYERGSKYSDVGYAEREGTRRKSGKTVFIIKDGAPDKNAFKSYLKNK